MFLHTVKTMLGWSEKKRSVLMRVSPTFYVRAKPSSFQTKATKIDHSACIYTTSIIHKLDNLLLPAFLSLKALQQESQFLSEMFQLNWKQWKSNSAHTTNLLNFIFWLKLVHACLPVVETIRQGSDFNLQKKRERTLPWSDKWAHP